MCNKVSITLTIKPIIIPKYLRNNIYISLVNVKYTTDVK